MNKVKVSDIAILNNATYSKKEIPKVFMYLDTGNLTKGTISEIQAIHTNTEKVPSRAQRKVEKYTILYSTVRPRLEHYGIIKEPIENMVVSTGFVTIDANQNIVNPYYLYYQLTSSANIERLASIADTAVTSYPSIAPNDIGDLEIDLPDLETQNKLVEILKNIDDKIKNNNAISSQLESLAKTIYDYWFLQFDFPDENGNPYRSSGGKMVWDDELKREIPEGWESTSLSKLCHLETTSIKPSDNPESIYFHYSIPAFDKNHYPTKEWGSNIGSNKYLVPENSILVSKLNPHFKRIWDPQFFNQNTICSTEFMPLVVENVKMHGFVYSLLNSDVYQTFMMQASSSSTGSRKRLQPEMACNFITPLPLNNKLLENYSKIVNPMLEKIKELTTENKELSSLRDFLLPLLMNGQVTIE